MAAQCSQPLIQPFKAKLTFEDLFYAVNHYICKLQAGVNRMHNQSISAPYSYIKWRKMGQLPENNGIYFIVMGFTGLATALLLYYRDTVIIMAITHKEIWVPS